MVSVVSAVPIRVVVIALGLVRWRSPTSPVCEDRSVGGHVIVPVLLGHIPHLSQRVPQFGFLSD